MRPAELEGQQFGLLKVIRRAEKPEHISDKSTDAWWVCECQCPLKKEVLTTTKRLKTKNTKSCGCLVRKGKDVTDQVVNNIKFIRRVEKPEGRRTLGAYWECECLVDGTIFIASLTSVQTGMVKSCGCDHKKFSTGKDNPNFKGFNNIPRTYFTECRNGAIERGLSFNITIEDMDAQFEKQYKRCALTKIPLDFGKWDVAGTASLDRIDNSRGYEVDNIQWLHKYLNKIKTIFGQELIITVGNLIALSHPMTFDDIDSITLNKEGVDLNGT